MSKFTLKLIPEIIGKIRFYCLEVNGKNVFQEFKTEIQNKGSFSKELITVQIRFQDIAELKTLPETKFKDITPKKGLIKEYEVKTKNLRVYMFHEVHTGRIVVLGGKKTSQKKDIRRFRSLKDEYLNERNHA